MAGWGERRVAGQLVRISIEALKVGYQPDTDSIRHLRYIEILRALRVY